jgi:hypothetical protein
MVVAGAAMASFFISPAGAALAGARRSGGGERRVWAEATAAKHAGDQCNDKLVHSEFLHGLGLVLLDRFCFFVKPLNCSGFGRVGQFALSISFLRRQPVVYLYSWPQLPAFCPVFG